MTAAYYNEIDPYAAQWLRNLIAAGHIAPGDVVYTGPSTALTDVWRALRASMRSVLEETSLADVAAGALPDHVRRLAGDYLSQEDCRGRHGG